MKQNWICKYAILALLTSGIIFSVGCNYNSEGKLTVTNTGPATLILIFMDAQTKLESGQTEKYEITWPGSATLEQELIWYPVIHPVNKYAEHVSMHEGDTLHFDLFYDPLNPPKKD